MIILKTILIYFFFALINFNLAYAKTSTSFDIDEEASVRALEHSLVQSGSLLLDVGKFELGMGLNFSRHEKNITISPDKVTNNIKNNFKRVATPLYVRAGLPYKMQVDLTIILQNINKKFVYLSTDNSPMEIKQNASGIGDVDIRLSKTLLREKGKLPDVIAYFSWNADNAKKSNDNIMLGNGFNDLKSGITLTKSQDPLVFSVSASAQKSIEKNNIKPGNQYALSVATFLAASPSTSLKFSMDQLFIDETKVNNKKLIGSDQTIALLNLGISSSINPKTFLSFSVSAGLTESSPDYAVNLSLSTRLNLP